MNTSVEGIIVNNCQYAPIYILQDPGATQPNTYVLASNNVDQPKPVINNLKTFYENSGSIENGLVNVDAAARPTAVKKKESILIGNNLKLANFLLPKNENANKQYVVDNVVLRPNIATSVSNPAPVNTVPKIDIDRKIVKLKEVPIINRTRPEKMLPKIKPKEIAPCSTVSKHTSVQLIKLGETYHSLNHLNKDQIKMVNQALKMFKDPDKSPLEPTYDPVTNTRYIYKVVSPKDLTVVEQKKLIVKDKKLTKIPRKLVEEKLRKHILPVKEVFEEPPEPEPPAEEKVTRSGRKVKLPKQILPEDSPQKSKKKSETIISCFQCSAEFGSLYRLQKHYENHPTHIPAKIHSNLFHCLLAIIKSGSEGDKTNIFIQQLEQLIVKLKSLLPCLLKKIGESGGQSCTINDDIGRLFGMNPGKYNIDVEALNCVKDQNGYCIHNPPKLYKYVNDPSSKQSNGNEEIVHPESETENCARINSVAKWPTVSKRIWKLKQQSHELSAKKMRLKSEGDTHIDLETEENVFNTEENNTASTAATVPVDDVMKLLEDTQTCDVNCPPLNEPQTNNITIAEPSKPKTNYVQFHSAHFDIRSSPIKPSSTVFRKFQINPSKLNNYQVQVIRSLDMVDKDHNKQGSIQRPSLHIPMSSSDNDLHGTLPHSNSIHVSLPQSDHGIHVSLPTSDNSFTLKLPSSDNGLQIKLPNSDNRIHATLPNSENDLRVKLSNSENGLHVSENGLHVALSNAENGLHVSENGLHVALSNTENGLHVSENGLHATLPKSESGLHATLTKTDSSLHDTLPSSEHDLHPILSNSENGLHVPLANTENSLDISLPGSDNNLHDIFQDNVDLVCKEESSIDPVLKDWIISTSEESQHSFTKSSSLIEPVFLPVRDSVDKCMGNNVNHNDDMPSLDGTDNRLLSNQGESVLNFLETLSNDLAYPETEIRNNGVDFQLDLFAFHNT